MRRLVTISALVALCSGCAFPRSGQKAVPKPAEKVAEKPGMLQSFSESRKLASARSQLEKGDSLGAARILEGIVNAGSIPGVTDEALFRLAILTLKPSLEHPASQQGHQLLRRLKKEYPNSPWTVQASPLLDLVNTAEELRRQNRSYRSTNQTLTREVNDLNKNINELNKNIEQLKHLDLELERKTR
jgi:TolA-binding protein